MTWWKEGGQREDGCKKPEHISKLRSFADGLAALVVHLVRINQHVKAVIRSSKAQSFCSYPVRIRARAGGRP